MTLPLGDVGVLSGLACGFLFGFVLENAGFGSTRKLTAQFALRDWSVFKVMFPAIIVAASGLASLRAVGWVDEAELFVPTTYYWATLLGGALVGAGFAIGGYCPGTSAVGCASGRLDALVFMVGLIAGTALFAAVYPQVEGLLAAAPSPDGQTLGELFGVSEWIVLAVLVAAAIGGFMLGSRLERKLGGPVTADEALGDTLETAMAQPRSTAST